MRLFDVFDDRFNKKIYEDKKVEEFLNSIKSKFVIVDGGFKISGDLDLRGWLYEDLSKIKELLGGDLVVIEGGVDCFKNKNLRSLDGCGLRKIFGNLNIKGTDIDDLGKLEYLGGVFCCDDDKIKYFRSSMWGKILELSFLLKRNKIVKIGNFDFRYEDFLWIIRDASYPYVDLSKIKEWLGGDLVEIRDSVDCEGNKVLESLGGCGLRRIDGFLDIRKTGIVDLGELEYLGGKFFCDEGRFEYFRNSRWGEVLHLR